MQVISHCSKNKTKQVRFKSTLSKCKPPLYTTHTSVHIH